MIDIGSGLAALLGAIIGGGITLIGNWLQSKQQTRRELNKTAFDLAMKEFEIVSKNHKSINPIETFVAHQLNFLSYVKDGKISMEDLKKVRKYNKELNDFYNSSEANIK